LSILMVRVLAVLLALSRSLLQVRLEHWVLLTHAL
jgi:hypothetical protein